MAINPNTVNILNIDELNNASSIGNDDLIVIGQGIYARKSTVYQLYQKFGLENLEDAVFELQQNQSIGDLGSVLRYTEQPLQESEQRTARSNTNATDRRLEELASDLNTREKETIKSKLGITPPDLTAEDISFDDTTTQLGETNVQGVIEVIVRRGVLKLEEDLVFEVGYDKQFTSISSAIEKAFEYYPNETYTVTILIDGGFEIEENLSYVNTDFSHIILSTTGEVTVDATLTGRLFYFDRCWLPVIENFEITGNYVMSHFFYALKCFAYSDSNLKVKGFLISIFISSSSSCRSDNSEIIVPALNDTYGYNVQNSYFRIQNTKIISENTSALSITSYAFFGNGLSNISISGGTSEISGNFRRGVFAQGAMFFIGERPIQSMEHDVFIERGGIVNDTLNLNRTSNLVRNLQTSDGLYSNTNFPIPYNFDGTDYILDYIKADEGEEFVVSVDEDGKLKSIKAKSQTILTQYSESSTFGDIAINLIQPDLGLPILEVEDLQEDSSYSGELVLNIENNNIATAKVIELFGAEIYNNTNPSADITAKITFTLNFFNQVGDDIDYKLSWEYLSSGEVLFGEHTGTIDNTYNVDFELRVSAHSTDIFNLKKARLWRN